MVEMESEMKRRTLERALTPNEKPVSILDIFTLI